MTGKFAARIVAVSGMLVLAGCIAPDPQLTYTTPAGLTPQTGAMVTGSLNKTGALSSDERVSLVSVDNQNVQQSGSPWATPVLVSPGLHVLQIATCECGFTGNNLAGEVSLAVEMKPGESYTLHATLPVAFGLFQPQEAKAWVADSSGNAVTPATVTAMSSPPAPVFVPLIIPVHAH